MIHGMQPLLLLQRGVLRRVEEAGEVVVEARRDHANATEDPVERTGVHAQPLPPEEERDRAAASQGDDVLDGKWNRGQPCCTTSPSRFWCGLHGCKLGIPRVEIVERSEALTEEIWLV